MNIILLSHSDGVFPPYRRQFKIC